MTKYCLHCGQRLENIRRRYCTDECRDAKLGNCDFCEKPLRKGAKKFCSISCRSTSKKGVPLAEEHKLRMRGRKLSQETLRKQNEAKRAENFKVFGDYACDVCDLKFDSNTALRSHKSYCTYRKSNPLSIESKCQICNEPFESERSVKIHSRLKHAPDEVKRLRSERMTRAHTNNPVRKDSLEEIDFYQNLKKIMPDAIRSFQIAGKSHVYDIYVPSRNLIIEYDGDYYHGNTERHELSSRMKKQYHLDISHTRAAIENGYNIVRVWGSKSDDYITALKEGKECLTLRRLV